MENQFKNYIFDLDGTIVNSSDEVLQCFDKAFCQANILFDKSRLTHNIIGPPLKEIIKNIKPNITDEELGIVMENFRQIYDYDENDISCLYEGILEFLKMLKKENKKIFLATFKPTIPTIRILNKFGITDLFDDIYTIDKFGKHITKEEMIKDIINKYNLHKHETLMIGDASSDVIAARTAGVTSIGALWGYGNDKTGLIENADHTINSIMELCKC